MNNLLLIGNGGHAISCIDVIEVENKYKIIGIVSKENEVENKKILYPNVGTDEDLKKLFEKTKNAFIGIGFIKNSEIRLKIFNNLKSIGFDLPTIVSPNSYIAKSSKINEGTILMHKSIINSEVKIGSNCIINTGSIIEHEVIIGDNVHVSTSTVINGAVQVGSGSFIGSNSVIQEGVKIGDNCIVAAGSYLRKDLSSGSTFFK